MNFLLLLFSLANSLVISGASLARTSGLSVESAPSVRAALVVQRPLPKYLPSSGQLAARVKNQPRTIVRLDALKRLPASIHDEIPIKSDVWDLLRTVPAIKARISENAIKIGDPQQAAEKLQFVDSVIDQLKKYAIHHDEFLSSFATYRSSVVGRRAKYGFTKATEEAVRKMRDSKSAMDKIMDLDIMKKPLIEEAKIISSKTDANTAGDILVAEVKQAKLWEDVMNMVNSLPKK